MSDTQMLSKYLPKKLYNAAADEDGTDLTALSGLANERLDVLEDWVGDYAAPAKGSESDIATDLKKVYADVETDKTGLLARATALETMIGDYTPEDTDLATDLAKVYGDVETAGTGLLARAAALEAVAPTTGAPITAQVAAKATYNTDKITFTADAVGADGNDIAVVATCQLRATLGSGTTEITLVGATGLHSGSTPPLVSVQITQAATKAPFSVTNTAGVIVCELPADANNLPIDLTMANLVFAIEAEMGSSGELDGVIVEIDVGGSFDPAAVAIPTAVVPFTAADNTVTEDGNVVTIYLANDGTNFDNWDNVVTEVNDLENSTLVTASAGAQSEAEPFEAISLTGGVDITAGAPGAIRYEADKIWISVGESTASVSNWRYAALL